MILPGVSDNTRRALGGPRYPIPTKIQIQIMFFRTTFISNYRFPKSCETDRQHFSARIFLRFSICPPVRLHNFRISWLAPTGSICTRKKPQPRKSPRPWQGKGHSQQQGETERDASATWCVYGWGGGVTCGNHGSLSPFYKLGFCWWAWKNWFWA